MKRMTKAEMFIHVMSFIESLSRKSEAFVSVAVREQTAVGTKGTIKL